MALKEDHNAIPKISIFSGKPLMVIRLGLSGRSQSKPPLIEHTYEHGWRVWTAYNQDLSLGTYYALGNLGVLTQETIKPDGIIISNCLSGFSNSK